MSGYFRHWTITCIVFYAALNGIFYALLLPLWEGFDEPFHYGYVQELSARRALPSLGSSQLSEEIWQSLLLAPASHIVQKNIPGLKTYQEYFLLSPRERSSLRTRLASIPPSAKYSAAEGHKNYEAHQAPLAYIILAVPDWMLSDFTLLVRVRILRITASILAIALCTGAVLALCREFGVPPVFARAALLLTFSSQMFYATSARVSNDWLAMPLAAWLFVAAIQFYKAPSAWSAAGFGALLSLGLLTKAYFLAFVPLFFGLIFIHAWRRRLPFSVLASCIGMVAVLAGPWYLRNALVYRSVSGVPETVAGVGVKEVVSALPDVPWIRTAWSLARGGLWTGNNVFNTFSRQTLNLMLLLLLVDWGFYVSDLRGRKPAACDIVTSAGVALYILALGYSIAVVFVYSRGASAGTSAWYAEVLLIPALVIALKGLSAYGRLGGFIAAVQVCLWTYVLLAGYLVKLVPQYGGHDLGSIRGLEIFRWYAENYSRVQEVLSSTTLASSNLLFALLVGVIVTGFTTAVELCKQLIIKRSAAA